MYPTKNIVLYVLFAAAALLPSAFSQSLQSIDFRGNSSYVHGAPITVDETKEKNLGRTIELVAHGTVGIWATSNDSPDGVALLPAIEISTRCANLQRPLQGSRIESFAQFEWEQLERART
jgi:hypothetical protein